MAKKNEIGSDYLDSIVIYIQKNRLQTFYNLVLLIFVFVFINAYTSVMDGVRVEVDLPPKGKIMATNNTANNIYYEVWTEHFTNNKKYFYWNKKNKKVAQTLTYSVVDFDYTNIEKKYNEFFKVFKQSKLIKEKHIYQRFIKNIKIKSIEHSFIVDRIDTTVFDGGHKAKSVVKGVSKQKVLGLEKEAKSCTYTFMYERNGGKIYVTSFKTNCF